MRDTKTLCIIMTYNRAHLIYHAIDQAYKQSAPVDVVIWNNGPHREVDIPLFKEVQVFHGVNSAGLHQRFVPALLYPHEHVMFLDDDLAIGPRFLENALSIIEQNEKALVVCMGSVIKAPLNHHNIEHRLPFLGMRVRNKTPWHLDLGSMGACVCKRKHVSTVFNNGFIPPHPAEEIAFSMMHKVYNRGEIILAPHDEDDKQGITAFTEEHYKGQISSSPFFASRQEIILSLGQKFGWSPTALNYPEWQPGGEAHGYSNR